jgi:Flp pilus assembly protein TadB
MGLAAAAAPALLVRRAAGLARQDVVHSLACWLELVALAQAGGMGVESALEAASGVAGDSSFLRIRRALERARHAGSSPWDGLGRLGAELGVDELEELAASLRLAGTEGARVRASLSAKSGSLRRRQMAEAQGRANAITERLFLPAIVLMIGFVVFLIYPAGVTLSRVL